MKKKRNETKMWNDIAALIINPVDKGYKIVNVTELKKNGEWMIGMNLITSIEDVLERAEKEGLNIIFEKTLRERSKEA